MVAVARKPGRVNRLVGEEVEGEQSWQEVPSFAIGLWLELVRERTTAAMMKLEREQRGCWREEPK